MRKFVLLTVVALLALVAVTTVYAASPQNEPPGLERAIAAQEAHNPHLLATPGVAGTAVGLTADGKPTVKIFTEKEGVVGLPDSLDGIPVVVEVTGKITAIKGPPSGSSKTSLKTTDSWPRPVPIGISTGNVNEVSAGTIAARVTDGTNVYALSNNHVYALLNGAPMGSEVLQPGLYDTGGVYNSNNVLGNLVDFVSLDFSGGTNYVDAAIALTDTNTLGNSTPTSLGGYGAPNSNTTTANVGMGVQKFGRTTKLTKGQITGINATVRVTYGWYTALFENQIIVESNKAFIKAGDSGSLLVTADSDCNPVGLLFAGNSRGTYAVANHIDLVLDSFGGITIDGK